MERIVGEISALFAEYRHAEVDRVEKLPASGSDRIYFRVYANNESFIATYNLNIRENETFVNFTRHFRNAGLPMPEVYAVNQEGTIYIQEDLGTDSLLDKLEREGYNDHTFSLFEQSLRKLAHVQIKGDEGLNYDWCLTAKEFGKQAILSDLLYFKYYFIDTLKMAYDKQAILDDFETLANYLTSSGHHHFMFRDFQSRNVVVNNEQVHFIDYQGGMKGALQYDVASMLWQAKANLSEDWKQRLLNCYLDEVENLLGDKVDREVFTNQYNGYVLIRLLQVLGAYGFRGLFERKAHFITSIPLALRNLQFFLSRHEIDVHMPECKRILDAIVKDEIVHRFEVTRADEHTPLVISIYSFSYKIGCPIDESDNGGGFLFDMRGIVNPGRFEEYKKQTGRDKAVIDFLEQRTRMPEFLNSVYAVVDISVEEYIKRGFENLSIGFGCTGGQHRSVYAADAMVRHLKNKYGVKIHLCHMVQESKNWVN